MESSVSYDEVYVVIPGYNEEKAIKNVIVDLKQHNFRHIIYVDDGSVDKSISVANYCGAHVLKHEKNQGQGAALKTGTQWAYEHGAKFIVHFDADGQMQAKDIIRLCTPLKEGKAEVTFGSRFLGLKSNVPLSRKIILFGAKWFLWACYGIKMTDPQSGFRALSRSAVNKINITQKRMAHCTEILSIIKKKKISFKEVPVQIHYSKTTMKNSKQGSLGVFKIIYDLSVKRVRDVKEGLY